MRQRHAAQPRGQQAGDCRGQTVEHVPRGELVPQPVHTRVAGGAEKGRPEQQKVKEELLLYIA